MQVTAEQLVEGKRENTLKLIARIIYELTIKGRHFYNEPDGFREVKAVNETIHRLSGHLISLADSKEPFEIWRASAVVESLQLLPDVSVNQIRRLFPS